MEAHVHTLSKIRSILQVLQLFKVKIKATTPYMKTSKGQQCLPNVFEVECTSL